MGTLRQYGSWALITGASSGLGSAFAELIASRGLNCVLVGLDGERLSAVAGDLSTRHGVQCRPLELDLARGDMLDRVCQITRDVPIGVLVNNAGIGCGGAVASRDPAKLETLVNLNCRAPVLLTRAFLPPMLARGTGAVVFVASLQAFISSPFEAAYCASKAFTLHFGESLWGELRHAPVDVITVCPAGMKTDFFKAEGFSQEDCDRMWNVSSHPAKVARLTLRHLGRRPVVSPCVTSGVAAMARFVPRRLVIHLSDLITRRLVRMERT